MALEFFRFLHASDFHLGQHPGGVSVLPDELIDTLIESPYKSVDAVVDTAIREQVEFVVLSGDVIHFPSACPRATEFLAIQFQRLEEAEIPVYWLGGRLEAGHEVPDGFRIPANVHLLPTKHVQTLEVRKGRRTIAYVVGQSVGGHAYANLEDMAVPRDGRFFVGVWYCEDHPRMDRERLNELGIDYWALGGKHQRQSLETLIPAEFCGTPQARWPGETGPHGCLLVQVSGDAIERTQLVETDALRYRTERIEVSETDDLQGMLAKMKSRIQTIRHDIEPPKPILITWEIVSDALLGRQLRCDGDKQAFLDLVRRETDSPAMNAWTIDVRSLPASIPPPLFDEDSILGDFLRAARELEHREDDWVAAMSAYLPDTAAAKVMADLLPLTPSCERQQLLLEVTTRGLDLLSGEES